MAKEPTSKQYTVLKKMIDEKYGKVYIDVKKGLGEKKYDYYLKPETYMVKDFDKGTPTNIIISTIKRFYTEGYESPLAQFLSNNKKYKTAISKR